MHEDVRSHLLCAFVCAFFIYKKASTFFLYKKHISQVCEAYLNKFFFKKKNYKIISCLVFICGCEGTWLKT